MYHVAWIEPIHVKFHEKHLFILVAVTLSGFTFLIRIFMTWPYELVELFDRLNAYKLVRRVVAGVGDKHP